MRQRHRSAGDARRTRDRRHGECRPRDRRRRRGGRRTTAVCRHRHVQRQDAAARRRDLPRRDRPSHPGPSLDARRPQFGHRERRAASPPPTEARPVVRHGRRHRGARAMDAPDTWRRAAGTVRADRRGHRPHQAAHRLHAATLDRASSYDPRPRLPSGTRRQPLDARSARHQAFRPGRSASLVEPSRPLDADTRDHRVVAPDRCPAGACHDQRAARSRCAALDRRLRHRLLVAELPSPAARVRAQDRPVIRCQPAARRAGRGDRAVHDRTRPQPRPRRRRRGRREQRGAPAAPDLRMRHRPGLLHLAALAARALLVLARHHEPAEPESRPHGLLAVGRRRRPPTKRRPNTTDVRPGQGPFGPARASPQSGILQR
jgi:hypothetical protein